MTITAALSTALPVLPANLYMEPDAPVVHEPVRTLAAPVASCGWPADSALTLVTADVVYADGFLSWCPLCWPGRRCRDCGVPSGRWVLCASCTHDMVAADVARDRSLEHRS